ncbi:unnamed protein product [Phytophthora fragariaefolia]|uniref:Unnamed protein product n=1 Tax=Phytophthora fragariaefolia TaxID=1490495 RepID=A0A9W7CZG9_9STRA|nr:unnamed protein product [Phytophthora fragariaefolia]
MDLSVKFEDFDSTERFIVLEMDKYDLILGMPWLEKHEPRIDWRGKAIGASRPALSDRALVNHVPTSVKSKGVRQDRQGASAPKEFMGVAEVFGVPQEVTTDSVMESAEALPGVKPSEPREASRSGWTSCPACGATKSVDPDTGSRRAVRASTDNVLRAAHQVDNLVPPEQGISQREPSVVAQGDSELKAKAPQTRPSDGHYHDFDDETSLRVKTDAVQLEALPGVSELLDLEEMSLDDFLADLKAGEIAEMVLLRPEPTPEELNSSSVMDEDVLEELRNQRASRLGSEILKNPKDPAYPLMKAFEDVVSKDPPSQLPPDRGIRHEIDLLPETKYCVTRKMAPATRRVPILALPDESKPFSVVCDASDYAFGIGCALLQTDEDGHERVISFQSRQLNATERNYPVHDKELLAMKYALLNFRVHLLGSRPFVVYTDHASLRTATNSPHLSQRIARWLSFFAEYNFRVEYKPGKLNVLADALSRRPDYELAHISRVTTDLYDRIRLAYRDDESFAFLARFFAAGEDAKVKRLSPRQRARLHRFEWADGLLHYRVEPGDPPRGVVPNDEDLKFDILQEAHDAPSSGYLAHAQ